MFEEADNFADLFRGGLPYYLLLTLPILIICSSNPVLASNEFTAIRMSQFDVNGAAYGCRTSSLSLEAKSLYSWSTNRHCIIAKLQDLTTDHFREIRQKAGGLVVLLPTNLSRLTAEEKEQINFLEQAMLEQPVPIPVYFVKDHADLNKIVTDITTSNTKTNQNQSSKNEQNKQRTSALSDLLSSISANGYQVIVYGGSHAASKTSRIPIIQGEIAPAKHVLRNVESATTATTDTKQKLPLVIVTANLKTFGIYNEYPYNADVSVLLTIVDLFSKMQNIPSTTPKYRLMFLLSESSSLLNFQGMKKWLDENGQFQNVDFVLCLDTIVEALNSDSDGLFMHVSKPPKEGTAMSKYFKLLKNLASDYYNMTVEGVHKKINLADQQLAWEHERFSMKRLPAFTLSSLNSPKKSTRITIFKDDDSDLLKKTEKHAKLIAESLARFIYKIEENGDVFAGSMAVTKDIIKSYLHMKSALHNNDLKNFFEKYLKNVKIIYDKPDNRDPDFMFYDGQEAKLNIYRVKPAVFDLFLTILICLYLSMVYFLIQYFPKVYAAVCSLTTVQPEPNKYLSNGNERGKSKLI